MEAANQWVNTLGHPEGHFRLAVHIGDRWLVAQKTDSRADSEDPEKTCHTTIWCVDNSSLVHLRNRSRIWSSRWSAIVRRVPTFSRENRSRYCFYSRNILIRDYGGAMRSSGSRNMETIVTLMAADQRQFQCET